MSCESCAENKISFIKRETRYNIDMEKLPKLTKREKGFIKDIINGETGVVAAKSNYNTSSYASAGAIACETLKKPRIQEAIKTIAEQIPDELLVEKHLALLNKKNKDGIDTQAVKAGLEMSYKLKGSYSPEKIKYSGEININPLTDKEKEELLGLLK